MESVVKKIVPLLLVATCVAAACSSTGPGPADVGGGEETTSVVDATIPDDAATLQDSGSCVPNCVNRECGPDGCGNLCGTCGGGETCDAGHCEIGQCGAGAPVVEGELVTDVTALSFDQVTVTMTHKQDIDPWEDGCIVDLVVDLGRGQGCNLRAEASGAWTAGGGLRVQALRFSADSQCPGFSDDREGVFLDIEDLGTAEIVPGTRNVPGENAPESCFATTVTLRLAGTLHAEGTQDLVIAPSSLRVTGEFISLGSTSASCACEPSCEGVECGPDGCGGECGDCGTSAYCDAQGQCVCVPDCSGRDCGDDGCGASCGACGDDEFCEGGHCVCQPDCGTQDCGDDGCGGSCGSCEGAGVCQSGVCVCVPSCEGRSCGDDGCGESCGDCNRGEVCSEGRCTCGDIDVTGCCDGADAVWCETATQRLAYVTCNDGCGWMGTQTGYYCGSYDEDPSGEYPRDCGFGPCPVDCEGRECGDDGCGGLCGTCNANEHCQDGQCISCQPDCDGRECGDDGCGASCGTCPGDENCSTAGLCLSESPLDEFGKACDTDADCWPGLECLDGLFPGVLSCTIVCTPFVGTECPDELFCMPNLAGGDPPGVCASAAMR